MDGGALLPKNELHKIINELIVRKSASLNILSKIVCNIWEGVHPFLKKSLGRGAPLPENELNKIINAVLLSVNRRL